MQQGRFQAEVGRLGSLLSSGNAAAVVIRKFRTRIQAARCDYKLAVVLDRIAAADLEDLRRVHFVEALIQQIGLVNDKRNIYGNDELYMNNIPRGLWQIPRQLAKLAVFLSSRKIESFLEIGTYTGHTFAFLMAYLVRFNPTLFGITMDLYKHNPVEHLLRGRFKAQFTIGRNQHFATRRFDFCFIDGDHSFDAVSADFNIVGRNSKICAFHDINDAIVEGWPGNDGGVPRFWQQLKTNHTDWDFCEFTCHSRGDRVMGIGVAVSKRQHVSR
jgi:hypothetical protein